MWPIYHSTGSKDDRLQMGDQGVRRAKGIIYDLFTGEKSSQKCYFTRGGIAAVSIATKKGGQIENINRHLIKILVI